MPTKITIPSAATILHELRSRRKAAGITQAQLAAELGWPRTTVSEKEGGKRGTWIRELDLWVAALERLARG